LIQILRINALRRASAGFAAAKARRVNPASADAKRQKAASATWMPPSGFGKMGDRGLLRFTAR
jgi:hypothetical protein